MGILTRLTDKSLKFKFSKKKAFKSCFLASNITYSFPESPILPQMNWNALNFRGRKKGKDIATPTFGRFCYWSTFISCIFSNSKSYLSIHHQFTCLFIFGNGFFFGRIMMREKRDGTYSYFFWKVCSRVFSSSITFQK